ncbi:MAG: copper chaperone PCu(A)C [Gammaproteobacteria bacterium]
MRMARFVMLTSMVLISLSAMAERPAAHMIVVTDPYSRAMPPSIPNSGAFFGLNNFDDKDHALVKAESLIAERVELHTHIMDNGVARMREVKEINIPAGGSAALAPGGYHVMLIGLKRPMDMGTKLLLTLTFDDGSQQTIVAPARMVSGGMHHNH